DQTLAPTVTLTAANGTSVSAAAPGPNQDAVIQTFKTPGNLWVMAAPQPYTVTVGGVGGSTGHYRVRLILNAAVEMSELGGPPDDPRSRAQSLDNTFVALGPSAPKADRGAVLGRATPTVLPGDVFASLRDFPAGGSVVQYSASGDPVQTIN